MFQECEIKIVTIISNLLEFLFQNKMNHFFPLLLFLHERILSPPNLLILCFLHILDLWFLLQGATNGNNAPNGKSMQTVSNQYQYNKLILSFRKIGSIAVTVNNNLPYIFNAWDFSSNELDLNHPVISFCSCKIVNYMAQCFHDFHIHSCV